MRRLVSVLAFLLALSLVAPTVTAQEATPASASSLLAGMGYPELRIQVHDDRFEVPEQITAGRTLIAYENVGQESRHSMLLRVPDDVDIEQALADAGPEAEEPPAWFFEATFPGFVGETLPGQTSYAVVDLTPGTYVVGDDFIAVLEVVGTDATPVASQAPATDGTVSLFEMGFDFPETAAPGPQVWEVMNTGTVPHELLLLRSSVPVTGEQLVELFMSEDESATPVGGGPSLADIEPVGGLGWLSPGATAWTEVTLEPGTYGAVCFVFDPETGMPHLMQGMVAVFTVGDAATPAG
jgi:hypothetical protein